MDLQAFNKWANMYSIAYCRYIFSTVDAHSALLEYIQDCCYIHCRQCKRSLGTMGVRLGL